MNNIPAAELSPRIKNGVLMWYEGDTFTLDLHLELFDQDDEPVVIPSSATIMVAFLDDQRDTVKEFTFTDIEDNNISMVFDSTVTALFPAGFYTYDLYYTAADRTTLINENEVVVE